MNNEKPTGRETQHKKEMEHKKLEDLTLFLFEKRVEGTTEVIGSNCLDQMRQGEVTFSVSGPRQWHKYESTPNLLHNCQYYHC